MKWFSVVALGVALTTANLQAASADQTYITLYNMILEADDLRQSGNSGAARNRYLEAQKGLQELQKTSPDWNKAIVEYRLKYLGERLGDMPAPAQTTPARQTPARPQQGQPGRASDPRDAQIQQLNQHIAQLQGEVATLNEKLKEALAVQPAGSDPRELAKAEERIKTLQKERDLLEVGLKQERANKGADPAQTAAARKQIEELKGELAKAADERKALLQQLENATEKGGSTEKLQREIASLRSALAERETELGTARTELKKAQSAKEEKATAKRMAKLEEERADLEKEVTRLKQDLKKKGSKGGDNNEVATLRARIQALEAQKEPYSAEELALMKAPAVALAATNNVAAAAPAKRSGPVVPAGAVALVREAQQAFSARRFQEAEEKYAQVLKLDEDNVYTLANLAAVQLEGGKLDEADKNLKRAVQVAPEDAYSHMLFGILRFRQNKYDDALDHLSRAAQLEPNNAETQNYLGITLSQKGQRAAAEAALRKSISLSPNNPSAHHNLAVIYATQNPAFPQLAKHHYQKSLSGGHPKNADLEKAIEEASAKK